MKFVVVLHNIRSCYNVGSVFRSADAFGVSKIFLGGYTPSPEDNKKVGKTALGAEELVPWEKSRQNYRLLENLKKEGYNIVALENPHKGKFKGKAKNIWQFEFPEKTVIVLGNEVKGLSDKMLERMDEIVGIPMLGKKESLNVSVAFGVAAAIISHRK